jgi:N-acyl-D-amino-acid deacylase
MRPRHPLTLAVAAGLLAGCGTPAPSYDLLIRNGLVYDGTGAPPVRASVAVNGDRVAVVGPLEDARGRTEIDAAGLAVAPGFINVLSWADRSLLVDGRSQGGIRQGVTLEILGEGWSMGPLNEEMKARLAASQGDLTFDVAWRSLGE